jgi:tetratricopeptide (TPR) repeat protein
MAFFDEALWKRLSPLLDQALELAGEPRAELIASIRAADPETAAALELHLDSHERALAADFLSRPLPTGDPSSLSGQVFGSYTLVERLGAGGMGSVWRARRSDGQFEGDAAIKLLHPSLLDDVGAERFRREGTILSRLTHPGIARLSDAGISAAGQPYLVLELVDGTRIDRHADAERLSLRARVELFLQVTDAVAHAHASLVVHRDLKPSNILVDREGRVKLLDFGIATLLDSASGEAQSRTAGVALTPAYAAPEQLEGGAITTATDVYALGGLLYELLTGSHPAARADSPPAELVRAITTVPPAPMSERVRCDESVEVASARATTRDRLSRALAGDLDTILAKALKKSPAERYPTVTAFADDLRRHLAGLPVAARPDTLAYRVRKLAARRKLEVAAVSIGIAALVGATAIAWRQARASATERDLALEELERAEMTNDLSSLLLQEAPLAGGVRAKLDLLLAGERMIAGRAAGNPALEAHLLFALSEHYYLISEHDSWRRILERARERARETDDRSLRAAVSCELAAALLEVEPERAPALLEEGLSELAGFAAPPSALARCDLSEAIVARRRGELERALAAARSAVNHERARPGPPGREVEELNTLAMVQSELGRFAEAGQTFEELFTLDQAQARGSRKEEVHRHNWGLALQNAGQTLRAVVESERAVELARDVDPENGPMPYELYMLASALSTVGRHAEALAAIDEALTKARTAENPQGLLWSLTYAERVHAEAGRPDLAELEFAELERLLAANPELAAATITTVNRFHATALLERGDARSAVAAARKALDVVEAGSRRPREILAALLVLARAQNDLGDPAAFDTAARARKIAQERLGGFPYSRHVGVAELEGARAAARAGETEAARQAIVRALGNLRETVGEEAPETRRARAVADGLGVD